MSELEEAKEKDHMNILKEIFYFSSENSSEIYPILKNADNIQKLKQYLNNKNINNENKLSLLKKLKKIFEKNDILIPLIIDKYYKRASYFFYPMIKIYFSEETDEENMKFIEEFILLINSHISLDRPIFEFIYQKLSKYFGNRSKINLNESKLIRYLRLLNIFYKDTSIFKNINANENNNNNQIGKSQKEIKNYIYFNGYNSFLSFYENNNPTFGNTGFPPLKNGFSIIFWIKMDKELQEHYKHIYPNIKMNLISISIGTNIITMELKEYKFLVIKLNDFELKEKDITTMYKENAWNNICFIFNPNEDDLITIYINKIYSKYNIPIHENFSLNEKISSIKLFENFLGKISSILFFSFPFDEKNIDIFHEQMENFPYGFYKNKILFRFLNSNSDKYFKNAINFKYTEKFKSEKNQQNYLKLRREDKNINNIISLFCPFAYYKETNQLDDIFGNYMGNLSQNDGVIFFTNHSKNIIKLGSIENLLPIAELMYSSIKGNPNPSYTQVNKGLLSENTLFEYLKIFKTILFKHPQNISYINSNNFFSNFSLFLERYPPNIFTEKIFNILLEIGIEIFKKDSENPKSENESYMNCILLNEKIFSKFSEENLEKLWQEIFKLFNGDEERISRLGYYFNIPKFSKILIFYDRKRYEGYCCEFHQNLFSKKFITQSNNKDKNENKNYASNVNEAGINKKLLPLYDIIKLYFNKFNINKNKTNENITNKSNNNNPDKEKIYERMNLYQLLSLDLSPCIQKFIIQVYIDHFKINDSIVPRDDKISTLINLLEHDFIEITEFAMSISLLDVRIVFIALLTIIIDQFFKTFISFYDIKEGDNPNRMKNFIFFIGQNLLPDQLKIKICSYLTKDDTVIYSDHLNKIDLDKNININNRAKSVTKKNKKEKNFNNIRNSDDKNKSTNITKYFNKYLYEKDRVYLNVFLINWIVLLCKSKMKSHHFIIDLLLSFGRKLSFDYIEKLSNFLLSIFEEIITNEKNIINNEIDIFENDNIYHWLVDTMFFFRDPDNLKNIKDDNKNKIQSNTYGLFKLIFSTKISEKIINSRIRYLSDYFYYKKNIYQNQNKKEKIEELENLARELLGIMDNSLEGINVKTIVCFEFMVFFKSSEKLFNILFTKKKKKYNFQINKFSKEKSTDFEPKKNENIIKQNNINNENISNQNIILSNDQKTENQLSTPKEQNSPRDFFPDYILENLYLTEALSFDKKKSIDDSSQKETKKAKNLNGIWVDYPICSNIILNYQQEIWGIKHLCDKVKVKYSDKFKDVTNLLLEKYGNKTQKNKNILINEVLKLLNWIPDTLEENNSENNNNENKKNKKFNFSNDNKKDLRKQNQNENTISILNINLILLSITMLLAKDNAEKNFTVLQYQEFLIFCILASINLNTSLKNYDDIQNILYNILGYGFSFLKISDEDKYNDLIKLMILPIIEEINNDFSKLKFRNLLGIQTKFLYKRTAIFKLFISEQSEVKDKEISSKKDEELKDNNNKGEGNKNDNKKNSNKNKVFFNFHGDINNFMSNIFNNTLEGYKNYRKNIYIDNFENYYRKANNTDDDGLTNFIELIEEDDIMRKKMKELIPFVKSQINENSIYYYNKEKRRRNNYIKIKKKIFSWKGFWSDRYLFFKHPEYLKLKIKNHYTKEMFKPIFSPVLDLKYYIPKFNLFDKSKLFHDNDYKYYINLNIDEILEGKNPKEKEENEVSNELMGKNNRDNFMKIKKSFEISNNDKSDINIIKNSYGFNYLESLYKSNYEEIWKLYSHKQDFSGFSSENKEIDNNLNEEIIDKNNLKKSKKSNKESSSENLINLNHLINSNKSNSMKCCLVKSSHHIKGNIITKKDNYAFYPEDNRNKTKEMIKNENDNDPKFDKLSGCCFGSYFKLFSKDKDIVELNMKYSKIKYIFIRVYFYYESALEIYTVNNKSYFFNFKTKEDMNTLLNIILKNCPDFVPIKTEKKRILGYVQDKEFKEKKKIYFVINKLEDWQNYKISTLEYLMWLNIYGGRSFNDVTQYPVFPWILVDYQSRNLDNNNNKRDFSLPMGMMIPDCFKNLSEERQYGYLEVYQNLKNEFECMYPNFKFETYLEKGEDYYHSYNNKMAKMKLKEGKKNKNKEEYSESSSEYNQIQINQIPYIFGSHYSNPLYTSHYLVRVFPFSFISIQILGNKFDDADRMFISLSKTFESVCTLKDDVRELIPEFYTLPEIFMNKNNLNLAQGKKDQSGKIMELNDVILPPWSENNAGILVSKMRNFMENNCENINKWIDLIFGYNQRGENADFANNLFMAQTYEKMVKIEEVDPDLRESLMRLIEVGVTPFKIFFSETKERINKNEFIKKSPIYCCSIGCFLNESKELHSISFNFENYKTLSEKHKFKLTRNEKEDNYLKIIGFKSMNNIVKNILLVFTSTNHLYEIKFNNFKEDISKEEREILLIKNYSYKYSCSYIMSNLKKIPFIIYGNCNYVIKGGFWDGRIELNTIYSPNPQNNKINSKCIFSDYQIPVTMMKMSSDEKYLFCGTKAGLITVYDVQGFKLEKNKNIFKHSDEITDISINSCLNMFATASKDGYVFLYILPSIKIFRVIKIANCIKRSNIKKEMNQENNNLNQINKKNTEKDKLNENEILSETENIDKNNIIESSKKGVNELIKEIQDEDSDEEEESENIYANNILLSSTPLPCITFYISKLKLFLTYTINGEFVSEQKEEDEFGSSSITCSKIFKNITFQEYLIYGTDKGIVKIRSFPDMKLIGDIIELTRGVPIEALEISEDNRFCYVWSEGFQIYIIKDINTSMIQTTDNISGMGFHI